MHEGNAAVLGVVKIARKIASADYTAAYEAARKLRILGYVRAAGCISEVLEPAAMLEMKLRMKRDFREFVSGVRIGMKQDFGRKGQAYEKVPQVAVTH